MNAAPSQQGSSNKNFFNPTNEIRNPNGPSSRKSSKLGSRGINKNSFYRTRHNPDVLGNKPTLGSGGAGSNYDPKNSYYNNYHNKDAIGQGLPSINNPNAASIASNMPGSKGSNLNSGGGLG